MEKGEKSGQIWKYGLDGGRRSPDNDNNDSNVFDSQDSHQAIWFRTHHAECAPVRQT